MSEANMIERLVNRLCKLGFHFYKPVPFCHREYWFLGVDYKFYCRSCAKEKPEEYVPTMIAGDYD